MNSKILDKCFKNTSKNSYYIFLIIAFEFFTIFFEIISITQNWLNRSDSQAESLIKKISDINPFHKMKKSLTCKSLENYNLCTFSDISQIFLVVLIIFFFILYILNSKFDEEQKISLASDKDQKSCVAWFFIRTGSFFANTIFLIFHAGGIFFLFCFSNFLLIFVYSISLGSYDTIAFRGVIFFLATIFYIIFVTYYFSYVKSLNVIVQFHEKLSFHSENLFSRTYDYFMIFIKILISLTSNLIIFENEKNSEIFSDSKEGNNSSIKLNSFNNKILFLTIFKLFVFFALAVFIYYKILMKKVIFIINGKFNLFRIFLINSSSIFLLFLIIFDSQLNDPILFGFTLTVVCISSFFITYSIYDKNLQNIFTSRNLIYQIAYAISKRNTQNLDQLNEDIYQMFMMHKLHCNKNSDFLREEDNMTTINENVCQICDETEYTFETFLKTFYAQTKFQMKKQLKTFSVEDMELFTMIELLYISILQKHKIIKLYFKIVEFLNYPTYRNKSVSLFLNIHRLKNFINLDNSEDLRIFRILKTYEETSNLLKKIIQISDDIYTFYEFEKEIYKRAEQINLARDEILSKILSLLKFSVGNKESEDLYSLILFKNIYEEIFNTNLDKYFYNFSQIEMDCKISEKFKTDRVMTIKYDVSGDSFLIIKASNELRNMNMKKLEDLFPDDLKLLARKKFLSLVKENEMDNFQFEFMIKDPSDEIYIQNVNLKGRVCPSLNFDELLINTTFEMSSENFILFEENFLFGGKKFLRSFSKNMESILCMNTTMLRNYKNYKFSFDDIFRNYDNNNDLTTKTIGTNILDNKFSESLKNFEEFKNSQNLINSSNTQNKKFECEMNKMHFIDLCLRMNRIHLTNDGEDLINLSNLSNLQNNKNKQKFILNLTQEIKRDYNTFSIYSIKISNTKTIENVLEENNISWELESIDQIITNPSTPSNTSYISNAEEKDLANFKSTKQALKSKNSTDNLNRLTYTASLFIIFLICYSFIFMIIGITDNKKIKESYSILMSFQKLKKTFYHTYTSLFNKFSLTDPDEIYFKQSYNNYFNNISTNSGVDIKFDEIAMIELRSKIDLLQQRMLEFQNLYLNSNYKKQVADSMDVEINYKIISSINGEFSLLDKNNNLFENIKTFMNLAQIIFEIQDIVKIDFINFNNGIIDFSKIKEKNYDTRQVYGMEIIINYMNIFKQTETISSQLQKIQDDKLYSIYITTLIFFVTFVLFHLSLIFICFYMIRSLRFLIANYLKLIDDLFSKNNIVYMKKKLGILRVLCEQYFEDPSKLLSNLKHNKKAYGHIKRKKRIGKDKKEKEELQNLENEMHKNYLIWENSERFKTSRNELILPIVKMITIVFSLFYVYAFIFYFLIRDAHEKFSKSSLIFSINSANENDLFNDYNLLQFMIFTRNTDNGVYNTLSISDNNKEKAYIKNKIQSIQDKSFKVLEIIQKNSEFDLIFQNQKILMNCSHIYTNLNDDVLSLLYERNDKKELLQRFFIEVCDSFPFMKNGEINIITQEVNYNMQQILFKYETNVNDVGKVLSIYNQPTLYYLYYALVYICRPIQQYLNYTLIYGLVDKQENFYLFILLLFLSLNILADALILIFIKFMTTKKVLYISNYIENFIDAIRIV